MAFPAMDRFEKLLPFDGREFTLVHLTMNARPNGLKDLEWIFAKNIGRIYTIPSGIDLAQSRPWLINDLACVIKDEVWGFTLGTIAQMPVDKMTSTLGGFLDLDFPALQSFQPDL